MNCFQTPGKWRSMACKDGIRGRDKTAHRLHPSIPVLIAGGPNPPPGFFGGNSKGSASRHLATNKNFFGGFSFLALEQTELLHVHIEKGSAEGGSSCGIFTFWPIVPGDMSKMFAPGHSALLQGAGVSIQYAIDAAWKDVWRPCDPHQDWYEFTQWHIKSSVHPKQLPESRLTQPLL